MTNKTSAARVRPGKRSRLASVPMVGLLLAAILAGCSVAPGTSPRGTNFEFNANRVTVVDHNDSFLYGVRDEVYVMNLWFRVRVNDPNSAQVGLTGSRDQAFDDLGDGETRALPRNEQATVPFNNVKLLDVGDLATAANKLEVMGTWTWAMEKDDVGVTGVQNDIINAVKNALNYTVAAGYIPEDPNELIPVLLGDFDDAFSLIAGSLFASIPGIPDDAVGSRFYVGVGATGTLSNIIDATVGGTPFPSTEIPIVTIPPDIDGGAIFSMGHNNSFTGQVFDSGDGRHMYDFSLVDKATLPKPPVASFTASATSGDGPLPVVFDAGASNDPDGTILSYNWTFGDFTTGAGTSAGHTFSNSGEFPVTLTVTDNDGQSVSSTQVITVNGAPVTAPTGLAKVSSGCCNTYGEFAWSQIPGATDYEIFMDAKLGCLTDHGGVVSGQVSSGRVTALGLCLGTQYDVSIRARANGQWGPWSGATRITL